PTRLLDCPFERTRPVGMEIDDSDDPAAPPAVGGSPPFDQRPRPGAERRHRQTQTEQHKSYDTLHLPSQFLVGALPLDTFGNASHCSMTPVTLPRAAGNEK